MLDSPLGELYEPLNLFLEMAFHISPLDPGLNQFLGANGNKPATRDQRLFFQARSFTAPSG
jgi:hypothetical protein